MLHQCKTWSALSEPHLESDCHTCTARQTDDRGKPARAKYGGNDGQSIRRQTARLCHGHVRDSPRRHMISVVTSPLTQSQAQIAEGRGGGVCERQQSTFHHRRVTATIFHLTSQMLNSKLFSFASKLTAQIPTSISGCFSAKHISAPVSCWELGLNSCFLSCRGAKTLWQLFINDSWF